MGFGFKLTKTAPDRDGGSADERDRGSGGRRVSKGCTQDRSRSPLGPSSGLWRASRGS